MSDSQQSFQTRLYQPKSTPSWRQLYRRAQSAKETEEITKAVSDAESAIFERWQELSKSSDNLHIEECRQLQEASDGLLAIKTQKLGWPYPPTEPQKT
jgi:hypothetical protein